VHSLNAAVTHVTTEDVPTTLLPTYVSIHFFQISVLTVLPQYTKINGTYEICDSDDMTPPGVFTTAPGQTTTWFQPFTGNPSPPYTPNPIASSNCQTFASTDLFLAAPTSAGAAPTGSTGATGSRSGTGAAGPTATGGSGSAGNSTNGGNNSAAGLHVGASLFVVSTALLGGIITVLA